MPLPRAALLGAAAAFVLATPATAQMNMNMPGMHMPGMKMPAPKKKAAKKPAAKAKPSAKRPAAGKAAAAKRAASKPAATAAAKRARAKGGTDGHAGPAMPGMPAGHAMSAMPGMAKPPAGQPAGHDTSAMPGMAMPSASQPAGHDMSAMPGMAMPGHDMGAMAAPAGTDLPAGDTPPPPLPADHAADAVYGAPAMAMGRHHLETFHGGQKTGQVAFNLAEYQVRKGRDGFEWNGQAWYGGDIDRLWVKSEGDGTFGRSVERAEVQALYSHAIGPYFNVQGGVRYDFKPNPSRVYATVGVEGLAPSFFEVEGALFLSNNGELLGRAEAYYDQRITQRLILQPRAELNLAAQSSRDIGIGAGLSDAELGLRLRYDIRREFAPYVGVQYRRAFGDTRRFARLAGEDPGGWEVVTGIRTWF